MQWINEVQNRDQWRAVVNTTMNLLATCDGEQQYCNNNNNIDTPTNYKFL